MVSCRETHIRLSSIWAVRGCNAELAREGSRDKRIGPDPLIDPTIGNIYVGCLGKSRKAWAVLLLPTENLEVVGIKDTDPRVPNPRKWRQWRVWVWPKEHLRATPTMNAQRSSDGRLVTRTMALWPTSDSFRSRTVTARIFPEKRIRSIGSELRMLRVSMRRHPLL